MNYQKQYADKINWKNSPDTSTPLNATNLNKMDNALWYMDTALYTISKAIGGGSSARGGIISNVGNNEFTTHVHQRTGESLAENELLILRSDVTGTGNSINVYTDSSSAVGFDLLDLDGESTSITVTTDSVVVLMITDADTDYTAQVLAVIDTAGGVAYSGLGIGKKTGVSSNVIDTDIDLHRSPMAGDRLLVYFDETVQNPTGLKTYNNGVAVTGNLENATPLYINAGWNILEFKNDLLFNNVWFRKQNIPVPSTLAGMSDTLIVSPSDDQLLVYDNGKWKNKKFIEANVGFSDTELKKIKVGDIVFDTDGLRDYFVTNIANNNITISVLNSNQFVMENIAINTGNHSGSSNGWNLVLNDGMNPVSVALKNADGTAFADDIHENELLFVYVDTAGNVARVLEIHSHDLEILKDAIITEKTVSGNPITITDALPYPAVSLSAEIEPIQDLHGYDKPWVGGAGKNKLPLTLAKLKSDNVYGTWVDNVYTVGNTIFTVNLDDGGNVQSISSNNLGENSMRLSFTLKAGTYILSSGFTETAGTNDTFMRAKGSSAVIARGNRAAPGQQFTLESDKNVTWNLRVANSAIICTPMVRISTESADFVPYSNICPISGHTSVTITDYDSDSNTATVTVQLGTTVYGGRLNVTTGVLTVDRVIYTYDENSGWIKSALTDADIFVINDYGTTIATWDRTKSIISNQTEVVTSGTEHATSIMVTQSQLRYAFTDYGETSLDDFKTFIASNNLQLCVYLATPTTIQLTPEQLTMLKGYNRLSCDGGGDITLTYKADRLAAIEAALAAL